MRLWSAANRGNRAPEPGYTDPVQLSEFDFDLPERLIAQKPARRRDLSRLLVVDRRTGSLRHRIFADLPSILQPADLVVVNDSKVLPARLFARRAEISERIEILLLDNVEDRIWTVLARPGRKLKPGTRLLFNSALLQAQVLDSPPGEPYLIEFSYQGDFVAILDQIGLTPLPPYIKRAVPGSEDKSRYQTVYAAQAGSVAAPTAGLHFTREILGKLRYCSITLHVGYGTFQPVTVERVEDHTMHSESYSLSPQAADAIESQRQSTERVVAVGTTTARALESSFLKNGRISAERARTRIFIYPGFRFQVVDALLTNFHLPRSSLLCLVCAFAGRDLIMQAYREAVQQEYRFFSYGDAMLIV